MLSKCGEVGALFGVQAYRALGAVGLGHDSVQGTRKRLNNVEVNKENQNWGNESCLNI